MKPMPSFFASSRPTVVFPQPMKPQRNTGLFFFIIVLLSPYTAGKSLSTSACISAIIFCTSSSV